MQLAIAALVLAASLPPGAPAPEWRAEHAERRARLAKAVGSDAVVVVLAAPPDGDRTFRQSPDFLYLTGVEQPGAALVLRPGDERQPETLYLEPRDRGQERWTGETLDPGDIDPATGRSDAARARTEEATGIGAVRPRPAFDKDIASALARGARLWIAAEPVPRDRALTPELALVRDLRDRIPGLAVEPLAPKLLELRTIKSPAEIAAIEAAVAITMEAEREVARRLRPGLHEYEVAGLLEYEFRRRGSRWPAFPSIVGSGPNATVLHYTGDRRRIEPGDLVLVDIGAERDGYAADVTRTFPASGRFSDEQRRVYDLVVAAQDAALAAVKPGARLRSDVHAAAKKVIADAGHGDAFPHGTSHYVGLEVHDVGERDGRLRPGMVITIEPGVYLADSGIGVRIEDMVLVTEDGYRLLTAALPRRAAEVEALMRSGPPPVASAPAGAGAVDSRPPR